MYPDYEGYEDLGAFGPSELIAYRQALLEKTKPQVDFILRHIPYRPLSVYEIGSGNGRFLIGLANRAYRGRSVLRYGWGVDLSASRVAFAEQWKLDWSKYLQYSVLGFSQENILDITTGPSVDLAVCITGCFQYFYPIAPDAPQHVLNFMRNSATYALFELYKRPTMGKTWKKLPDTDRWAYLLDNYEDVGDWVRHTKTFIGRDGSVDERTENLAYYTMPVFIGHLQRNGYTQICHAAEDSTSFVVLAK